MSEDTGNILRIELPGNSMAPSPGVNDIEWLKALWEELLPLRGYWISKEERALSVFVRNGEHSCNHLTYFSVDDLPEEFETVHDSAHPDDVEHFERGWWVATIGLYTSGDDRRPRLIEFFSEDFKNGGERALFEFRRVVEHLKECAIPQDGMDRITKALAALDGK